MSDLLSHLIINSRIRANILVWLSAVVSFLLYCFSKAKAQTPKQGYPTSIFIKPFLKQDNLNPQIKSTALPDLLILEKLQVRIIKSV